MLFTLILEITDDHNLSNYVNNIKKNLDVSGNNNCNSANRSINNLLTIPKSIKSKKSNLAKFIKFDLMSSKK